MPRFVLLYHTCPLDGARPSHWDLMFDVGDTLRTWAIDTLPHGWGRAHQKTESHDPQCPPLAPRDMVDATPLADHRRAYLDYQGPISRGRGSVIRVDEGTYALDVDSPEHWRAVISGRYADAKITLRSDRFGGPWQLTFQAD